MTPKETERMKMAEEVRPQHALEKVPTGIPGFDEASEGGVPRGRGTLVAGGPGAGKTIFALQALVNGARRGEPGIFVAFEENSKQLITNADTFGWDLLSLIDDRLFLLDARVTPNVLQAGEFDLNGLLAGLSAKATQMGAKHIVFDSLDILLALLDDPRKEREEIYRLHDWLLDSGLTGFITVKTDSTGATVGHRYDFMQFMVDCVVLLTQSLTNRVSLRELRIAKYRGSPFAANACPVTIGPAGMEVGGVPPGADIDFPVSSERVCTGIPRLDSMLNGGYFRGSSALISGSPGTAKSTLAGAAVEATCRRGERAIYISFDEAGGEIVRNLSSVGIELAPHIQAGLLQVHGLRTESGSGEEHLLVIRKMIAAHQPTCLVVDPLSAMIKAGGHLTALAVAQRLIRMTKQAGITTLCTSLVQDSEAQAESTPLHFISTIADTWIHLSYLVKAGERNRALTIVKSRGTKHSNQVRELVLSDQGIDLTDVYTSWGEVLMGTARWQKETEEEAERIRFRREIERKERELEVSKAEANARIDAIKRDLEYRQIELETILKEQKLREDRAKALHEELSHKRGGSNRQSADGRE